MSPRRKDPFKPEDGVSFPKSFVDKSARLVLDLYKSTVPTTEMPESDVEDAFRALRAVEWWRSLHALPLTAVASALRYHVGKEKGLVDDRIDVTQRLKRRSTMIWKLDREPKMKLSRMGDIGGVRVRLPTLDHVYAVSRRLRKNWTITRTRDYVAEPTDLGYRAIHHIVRRNERLIEVQLRTVRQDAWANQVEEDGRLGRIDYKFGRGALAVHDYYRAVGDAFAVMDLGKSPDEGLVLRINTTYRASREQLGRTIE